jgi:A/G-specific adenine glycosylase
MKSIVSFRKRLREWYERHRRDLPWRQTADPYRVWVSEIMLQQTRVAAVIPYYERFLARFPSVESLAAAEEGEVLTHWAGLGYYSRARNLQKAARQIVASGGGGFPQNYEAIRALSGIGDYTAAAVASIAFQLPHAVVDGNVLRVLARLDGDGGDIGSQKTRQRFQQRAQELLDCDRPDLYNQAVMELGATVCLPRQPQCLLCPVREDCKAASEGTQDQLPVKLRRMEIRRVERVLLWIENGDKVMLWQRPEDADKLQGFWELPGAEQLPAAVLGEPLGTFRHSITNTIYTFTVLPAQVARIPRGFRWIALSQMDSMPVSTTVRKARLLARKAL